MPRTEELYVIGSFAKSVTVYSQQVRAINLIDAMCGLGRLKRSSRVALIGGGIAGLTAAAALKTIGVSVTIFEKASSLIPVQRNSGQRYIHPRIYDWPIRSIDETNARLPIMNWEAGRASDVAQELENEWNQIAGHDNSSVRLNQEVTQLQRSNQQWVIHSEKGDEFFDIVISSVGFGEEPAGSFSYPYWADLPLENTSVHSWEWLVSGAGDGALTDLMRLCIRDFAQGDALKLVVETVEEKMGKEFLGKLCERITEGKTGPELFNDLDASSITQALKLRENLVTLNASVADLFGTSEKHARSSVLNRLITWVLIEAGKVKLIEGRIPADGITGQRLNYQVRLKGSKELLCFDDVLLRHGPEAPFNIKDKNGLIDVTLPGWMDRGLQRQVIQLVRLWKKLYESNKSDPTTQRDHWGDEKVAKKLFDSNRLSPDFEKYSALFLYSKEAVGDDSWAFENGIKAAATHEKVRSALNDAIRVSYSHETDIVPLHLEHALDEPRSFGRTIRALCDAPIAIFDGTVEHPYLMFLLGIRSVVRRGVTVVVHIGDLNAVAWQKMAFNLRELSLVTAPERSGLSLESAVRETIVEGLKLYARHPFQYSDLPAFMPTRNLGGGEEDFLPRRGEDQVLVLCPFDDVYTKNCWPEIQRALRTRWTPDDDKGLGPARRVIDLRSPELVGRRLFDAIRRDDECIADQTQNKANVFFELGARMVTNKKGARVVRCVDELWGHPSQGILDQKIAADNFSQLDKLIGVKQYSVQRGTNQSVSEALCLQSDWPGGTVTPAYAYTIAQDSVSLPQEGGGQPVESLLWNVMEETIGRNRSQKIYPVLYANENSAIQTQARHFAFDALLAYILFTDALPAVRRDENKRAIALVQLENMLRDLVVDSTEQTRLKDMIVKLKGTSL